MKEWGGYLISAVAFGIIYTLMEYLFSKNIDWKMVIVATLIYAVLNTIIHIISKRLVTKK